MTERARADQGLPYSPYFAHTVRRASSLAARRGSAVVGMEHFLFALLDDPDALALLEGCNADIASIRVEIGSAIEKETPRRPLGKDDAPQAEKVLRHVLLSAEQGAREAGRRDVNGAIALAALVGQSDSRVVLVLNRHGLSFGKALGWIDSQAARAALPPAPTEPAQSAPARRPRPAPKPNAKAPSPAPPAKPGSGRETTLEEMLSTIRDVIDEETFDRQTERPEAGSAEPRRSAPPAAKDAPASRRRAPPGQKPPPAPRRTDGRAPVRGGANGSAAPAKAGRREGASKPGAKPAAMMGKLVERIPRVMRQGTVEHIEVRIGREATEELIARVQGRGATNMHTVAVTRAMSLYLRAPHGGFMIEPLAPETQWVFDRPSFLENEPFGRWRWTVLPMKRGSRRLQLVAAARSVDENGMIGDVALPEQVFDVTVRINWTAALQKVALWAGLAVAGGVLAQVAIRFVPGLAG